MIRSFRNQATEDIFDGKNSKYTRKLEQIDSAVSLDDQKVPPGNRLEALEGDRADQYSIRINDQCQVCFTWNDGYADNIEIVDYHH